MGDLLDMVCGQTFSGLCAAAILSQDNSKLDDRLTSRSGKICGKSFVDGNEEMVMISFNINGALYPAHLNLSVRLIPWLWKNIKLNVGRLL